MSEPSLNVHPAVDIFPMMSDAELQELADDIKANGLIHPVIVDSEGRLVDGRNRLAACKLAGVTPITEKLNGQDPVAYIIAANLKRRNLSKGQQAMVIAMLYPEPEKGGRGKRSKTNSKETLGFSPTLVSQARAILQHSRELAESVLNGTTPLDEALRERQAQKTGTRTRSTYGDFFSDIGNFWAHNHDPKYVVDGRANSDPQRQELRSKEKESKLRQELAKQLIDIGYKVLATRLHPDHGGSKEAMVRLNIVRESLSKLIKDEVR